MERAVLLILRSLGNEGKLKEKKKIIKKSSKAALGLTYWEES